MKSIKRSVLIILILFNIFFPITSFASQSKISPVTLTTGLPFFPEDCKKIEDTSRRQLLCYKDASGNYTGDYNSKGLIKEVFEGIFKFILGSAGTLCVIMLIVSGLQISFAAGNADILGKARDRMKNSVIGLILTVSSGFILSIINPQLLDFDIKGPEEYTISGFTKLEGKEGSQCINDLSCDDGLYCYKEKTDDLTGKCKKYREPGESCIYTDKCKLGYDCRQTADRSFTCIPSSSINELNEGEFCFIGNNNCKEGFFCSGNSGKTECVSCNFYYNERENLKGAACPSSSYGYTPYCNHSEIKNGECPLKSSGESCSRDGECDVIKCIEGLCAECLTDNNCSGDEFCNNGACQEKECDDNSNCAPTEFCNTTGKDTNGNDNLNLKYKCETKRTIGQYCEPYKLWCLNSCNSSISGDHKCR